MSLFFIRHGESDANVKKYFAGQLNVPLTPLGISQAEAEAKSLADSHRSFDVIMSSNLDRAYETAVRIAKAIGYPAKSVVVEPLLTERAGGVYEGKPLEEFFALSEDQQIEGGAESFKHLGDRATALLKHLEANYTNKDVLLVSHATFGEMLQAILKYNDYSKILDGEKIPNATMIKLK